VLFLNQEVGEGNGIGELQSGMDGYEAMPDGECGRKLVAGAKLANDREITVAIRGQDGVEDGVDIGGDAPAAREGFGAAPRVRIRGAANFREGLGNFILAEKKISVAPGNGGGKRISALGLEESVAGVLEVTFGFIHGGEVQPGVSGAGIQGQGVAIVLDGVTGVGIFQGVLPIAAEEIPVLGVTGLEASGGFEAGARA
jgi:hypothetical protein